MQDAADDIVVDEKLAPPSGDPKQAEKYITKLIDLLNADKIQTDHTDLSKFDPSSLQDHYRLDLKEYCVEISHSKNPNSGNDSFVILFTNLQNVRDGCTEKIILAYMHLSLEQFKRFAYAAGQQFERIKKAEEEKRLNTALVPIDEAIKEMFTDQTQHTKPSDASNNFVSAYS